MEKSSWTTVKDGKSVASNTSKIQEAWHYKKHHIHGEDLYNEFSWPPRSYTCSFCKREFRSAQALGGHMNVHRRDRAMLRQSPPWEAQATANLNLNRNPNPSFSTLTPSTRLYSFPSMLNSSIPRVNANGPVLDLKYPKGEDLSKTMKTLKGFREDEKVFKKKMVRMDLDLEIGLCRDHVSQDLDLELRLGYS